MRSLKEALSLGLELSGFIFAGYFIHKPVASTLGYGENATLTALIVLSLILWTVHVCFFVGKKK